MTDSTTVTAQTQQPFSSTILRILKSKDTYSAFLGPVLSFHSLTDEGTFYAQDQGGHILRRQEFEELVSEWAKFYEAFSDEEIKAAEDGRETLRESSPSQPKSPEPRRTRHGYVYLMVSEEGHYKIGRTRDLKARSKQIGTKMPFKVTVAHSIASDDYKRAEAYLHHRFARVRGNGEWFDLSLDDVRYIKSIQFLNYAGSAFTPGQIDSEGLSNE